MRVTSVEQLVDDALKILGSVGVPTDVTPRRKIKMAKAFISVCGLKPGSQWSDIILNDRNHQPRSRDIIRWMNDHLGENISSGSYDDIRRKDLLHAVEVGIVLKSAGNEAAATNDGTRGYAVNPDFADLIKSFGTERWSAELEKFNEGRELLAEQLRQRRQMLMMPVKVNNEEIKLGPGEHNEIQKAIIEQFLPRFGHSPEVLYVGDTEDKGLYMDNEAIQNLGFFELSHDKLPDVLAYSQQKNWVFVIEAVHSANPIDSLRKMTIERLAVNCTADLVFVTAFLNRAGFRKFAAQIAWETEVWIAEEPDHMIHFNGDKFLGPHSVS